MILEKDEDLIRCYTILSVLISCVIAYLVFLSGGTKTVYANLMYVPVAVLAAIAGVKRGIFIAIISALMIGPLMPLEVSTNTMQSNINWIVRLFVYTSIATVIGYFSDMYNDEYMINKEKTEAILKSQYATIFSLVKLSESRDDYTGTHIERIAEMCRFLCIKLYESSSYSDKIDKDYINNIYRTSPLHDVGKVGIPDNILLKRDKLTSDEFEHMKNHTLIGWRTLKRIKEKHPESEFINFGMKIARYHHERWDGSGYPDGLKEDEIPLKARITTIVDVYDALRSERPYKEGFSHQKALEIIQEGKGSHFDPILTELLIKNEQAINEIYNSLTKENITPAWAME